MGTVGTGMSVRMTGGVSYVLMLVRVAVRMFMAMFMAVFVGPSSIFLSSFPTHITASSVAEAVFQKLVPYRSVVKSMLYLSRLMTRPAHVFANCMDCGEINS